MKDKISTDKKPSQSESFSADRHPSRNLAPRAKGYGIGGGFEKPYRKKIQTENQQRESYGPIPHSGYYGAGAGAERFERGEAGFNKELSWYAAQYGEETSGFDKKR
jgi:hypothetical protein